MPSKIKTCADYREAFRDAAAAATELPLDVRSHVNLCESCSAAFREEQQLFAAMHGGLRISANAEVPASLLPRVRAELNKKNVPQRSWFPVAAALATAAVVVAIVFARAVRERKAIEPHVTVSAAVQTVRPADEKAMPVRNVNSSASDSVRRHKAQTNSRTEEVAVLVPAGQKRATDALIATLQRSEIRESALFTAASEDEFQQLHFAPLELAPIEMKPLPETSDQSPSKEEKSSR